MRGTVSLHKINYPKQSLYFQFFLLDFCHVLVIIPGIEKYLFTNLNTIGDQLYHYKRPRGGALIAVPMKRKSRFDIRPEDMPHEGGASSTPPVTAAVGANPQGSIAPPDLARIIASFGLDSGSGSLAAPVTSVYPPKFKLRLEKAMEKNLNYIQRLDAGELRKNQMVDVNRTVQKKPPFSAGPAAARPGKY